MKPTSSFGADRSVAGDAINVQGHVAPDDHVYRFKVLEFTIPGVTYHVLLAILSPHICVDTYQITLQITYPRYI